MGLSNIWPMSQLIQMKKQITNSIWDTPLCIHELLTWLLLTEPHSSRLQGILAVYFSSWVIQFSFSTGINGLLLFQTLQSLLRWLVLWLHQWSLKDHEMVGPHDELEWFRLAVKVAHFVVSSLAIKEGNIHKFSNSIFSINWLRWEVLKNTEATSIFSPVILFGVAENFLCFRCFGGFWDHAGREIKRWTCITPEVDRFYLEERFRFHSQCILLTWGVNWKTSRKCENMWGHCVKTHHQNSRPGKEW